MLNMGNGGIVGYSQKRPKHNYGVLFHDKKMMNWILCLTIVVTNFAYFYGFEYWLMNGKKIEKVANMKMVVVLNPSQLNFFSSKIKLEFKYRTDEISYRKSYNRSRPLIRAALK